MGLGPMRTRAVRMAGPVSRGAAHRKAAFWRLWRGIDNMRLMRKKFGQILLEQGLITPAQLADALTYQGRNSMRLGQALVARGHITEDQLVISLGQALSTRVVDLSRVQPEEAALDMVQPAFASEHDLFPISVRAERGTKRLTVAVADPLNLRGLDELGFMTDAQIEPVLAKSTSIDMAIRRHYGPRLNHLYSSEGTAAKDQTDDETAIAGPDATEIPEAPIEGKTPEPPILVADSEDIEESLSVPIPLTQKKRPISGFDAELGALIEAAGESVQDEAIGRLERRFWALMRVLAKKGLVNNEEFLRELNEEETAFRSR